MPAPIVTLFLAVLLVGTTAAAGSLQDARKTFLAAEKALRAGDQAGFDRLRRQLRDYPLRPYPDYAYLRKHLGTVSEREVVGFLDANRDTPLAGRLQAHWLDHLGRR